MLVDTHAHLNFKDYESDCDEVVKMAFKNGVWIINAGANFETSKKAVELAEKYPQGVFAAVGLHPSEIANEEFSYEKYKELALSEKVVAIGEIGLDYFRLKNNDSEIKEKQKEIFIRQIELAAELKKPVSIHCRYAHNDVLEILNFKLKGVIHCFTGTGEQAKRYRELGFKLAFNGIITFSRDYDEILKETPIEDILLETDCPYLAPVPYRGRRNEPSYVVETAKKLAEIKNLPFEEAAEKTFKNAAEVFKIEI